MNGQDRRKEILEILRSARGPVSGAALASRLHVSRQVIVQDIALIRAGNHNIYSTNRGYLLNEPDRISRVFKVIHKDSETEEELLMIVDLGGCVEDVFIYHKVYGVMRGELGLKTRLAVKDYMEMISSGKSSLLMNVTSGYHYHTVSAEDERTLDLIRDALKERGFLAGLQDYEPVDFSAQEKNHADRD